MKEKFLSFSYAKIKEGIFVDLEIKTLIRDEKSKDLLNHVKKSALRLLKMFVKNVLGNCKALNYCEVVGELLQSYKNMGGM